MNHRNLVRVPRWISRFHDDERGVEYTQVVAILAVGALVMVLVYRYGEVIAGAVWATPTSTTPTKDF